MTNIYKTSEVARIIGIHPNTVRLYEELELIPKPERRQNGYRVFTDFHIEQFRLARTALKVEILQNGYRVYTDEDIRRLKIIRSLRCANYSLSAILRMLGELSRNPQVNIKTVIDTPGETDNVISVCDKLLTSLRYAEKNAGSILLHLEKMKIQFEDT